MVRAIAVVETAPLVDVDTLASLGLGTPDKIQLAQCSNAAESRKALQQIVDVIYLEDKAALRKAYSDPKCPAGATQETQTKAAIARKVTVLVRKALEHGSKITKEVTVNVQKDDDKEGVPTTGGLERGEAASGCPRSQLSGRGRCRARRQTSMTSSTRTS